jgi:hypothetical protein
VPLCVDEMRVFPWYTYRDGFEKNCLLIDYIGQRNLLWNGPQINMENPQILCGEHLKLLELMHKRNKRYEAIVRCLHLVDNDLIVTNKMQP